MTVVVFERGCVEVDLWVCSTKLKKFGRKRFYDEHKSEWDMHSAGHLVMCLVVVGRHIDVVYGIGQRNFKEC